MRSDLTARNSNKGIILIRNLETEALSIQTILTERTKIKIGGGGITIMEPPAHSDGFRMNTAPLKDLFPEAVMAF